MKLKLIPDTDPILSIKTEEMTTIPPTDIIFEMFKIMEDNRGIGLAAPQVGISQRFFIMANTSLKYVDRIFINPKILMYSTTNKKFKEGCLSFKGQYRETNRPQRIQVSYTNLKGEKVTRYFSGIWSICFQHELDHLNGITFNNY